MLDESICHLGGARSVCRFYATANTVVPDQTPHYVASIMGLDCFLMILYGFPGKNEVKKGMRF